MLGKAVHSLSRIGDELYLEPLKDGVRGGTHGWGRVRWEMGSLDWRSLSTLHNMMVWAGISAQLFSSWVGGASAWALTSEAACVYVPSLKRQVLGRVGLK